LVRFVLVLFILVLTRRIADSARSLPMPQLHYLGTVLSKTGLGAIVLGVLQSSTWGWAKPRTPLIEPFGLSLTLFVIGGRRRAALGIRAVATAP
jgi:hypothetical protein